MAGVVDIQQSSRWRNRDWLLGTKVAKHHRRQFHIYCCRRETIETYRSVRNLEQGRVHVCGGRGATLPFHAKEIGEQSSNRSALTNELSREGWTNRGGRQDDLKALYRPFRRLPYATGLSAEWSRWLWHVIQRQNRVHNTVPHQRYYRPSLGGYSLPALWLPVVAGFRSFLSGCPLCPLAVF